MDRWIQCIAGTGLESCKELGLSIGLQTVSCQVIQLTKEDGGWASAGCTRRTGPTARAQRPVQAFAWHWGGRLNQSQYSSGTGPMPVTCLALGSTPQMRHNTRQDLLIHTLCCSEQDLGLLLECDPLSQRSSPNPWQNAHVGSVGTSSAVTNHPS